MQKFLTLSALCAFSSGLVAQVGINTLDPKATFEVAASTSINKDSIADGILPPRLTKLELANKVPGTYNNSHKGLLVFISDVNNVPVDKNKPEIEMIKEVGYYVFSGNAWSSVVTAVPVVNGVMATPPARIKNSDNEKVHLGSNITLPPGKWEVEIFITLEVSKDIVGLSYNWVKLSFTDIAKTNADLGPNYGLGVKDTQSKDIISKSKLISGFVNTLGSAVGDGNNYFGIVNGKMIIENKGGSDGYQNKTYFLYYDNVIYKGSREVEFINLGGNEHLENYIVATRIQ